MNFSLGHIYQFSATLSALLTLFVAGISEAWTSVYIPRLLDGDPVKITGDEGSWIAAFLSIGGLIGCLFSSTLADKLGRKTTLLLTAIPYLVSAVMLGQARSILVFYIARLVLGTALGIVLTVTPLYLGEIAHESIRGALGTCFYVFLNIGNLFVNVLGTYVSIPTTSIVSGGVVLLFLVTFVWMPESAYYLVMVDRHEEAKNSLRKFRGSTNIETEFARIKDAVQNQKDNSRSLLDIIKVKTNRRALFILFIALNGKQLSGDAPFYAYAQTIFETVCDVISPVTMSAIFYSARLLSVVFGTVLIDRVGRRPMLSMSCFGFGLNLLLIAGYIFCKLHTSVEISEAFKYGAVVLMAAHSVLCSCLVTIPVVILSELFGMDVKTKASLLYGIYFFLTEMAQVKFLKVSSDLFGMDVPFLFFSLSSFVHFGLVVRFVVETKGKTLEEIQGVLRE